MEDVVRETLSDLMVRFLQETAPERGSDPSGRPVPILREPTLQEFIDWL